MEDPGRPGHLPQLSNVVVNSRYCNCNIFIFIVVFFLYLYRKCAIACLEDVSKFLTRGGQVAVS